MPEYSSVTGLKNVKFAPLKKVGGFFVTTEILDYEFAINMKVETETSTEKQYADDKLVDLAVSTGSTKLDIEMRDLPMEISLNYLELNKMKTDCICLRKISFLLGLL